MVYCIPSCIAASPTFSLLLPKKTTAGTTGEQNCCYHDDKLNFYHRLRFCFLLRIPKIWEPQEKPVTVNNEWNMNSLPKRIKLKIKGFLNIVSNI